MDYLISKLLPLDLLHLGLSLSILLMGCIGSWPVIAEVVLLWVCALGWSAKHSGGDGIPLVTNNR